MGRAKEYIPKILKEQVWLKYMGNFCRKQCPCCKNNIISSFYFNCGHIVSERFGGVVSIDNLVPICGQCNSSMYTKNLFTFMKELGFLTDEIALIRYGTKILPKTAYGPTDDNTDTGTGIKFPVPVPDNKNDHGFENEIKPKNFQKVYQKESQKEEVKIKTEIKTEVKTEVKTKVKIVIDSIKKIASFPQPIDNNSHVSWCEKADCITGLCKKNGPYENKQKKEYFKYKWSCCGSQAQSPDYHTKFL